MGFRAAHQKAQGPDQAPEGVARLGVSHSTAPCGDRLNASFGPHRRKANARNLRESEAAQSALNSPWRRQRIMPRTKLRMLLRKASSTLAPPWPRPIPRGAGLDHWAEVECVAARPRRVAVACQTYTAISVAGRNILPHCVTWSISSTVLLAPRFWRSPVSCLSAYKCHSKIFTD